MSILGFLRSIVWPKHPATCDWVDQGLLVEPGISDVDYGRWSRKMIRCARCGARRRVWQGLSLMDPVLRAMQCPSEDTEIQQEMERRWGNEPGNQG